MRIDHYHHFPEGHHHCDCHRVLQAVHDVLVAVKQLPVPQSFVTKLAEIDVNLDNNFRSPPQ